MPRKIRSSSKKRTKTRSVRTSSRGGIKMSLSTFNKLVIGLYSMQTLAIAWFVASFFNESARHYGIIPVVFLACTLPMSFGFYLARRYGDHGSADASTWMQISNYNNLNNINRNLNDINKKF
jgi:hypothetical protein